MVILESADDIQWAKDNFPFIRECSKIELIELVGNEDCPKEIKVYSENKFSCKPDIWIQNPDLDSEDEFIRKPLA